MNALYVNTAGYNDRNYFTVLDYEVFGIDNYTDYVSDMCKHPDIIMEYMETKDIANESLERLEGDNELLDDLDLIHCDDSAIRVKISRYFLKMPSKLLENTLIVEEKYDDYLREWAGNYKWKLIYRASEHEYTGRSFHECCDNVNGPTLVIIKSSGGWIFGGYTTQSWSGNSIYYDMI